MADGINPDIKRDCAKVRRECYQAHLDERIRKLAKKETNK